MADRTCRDCGEDISDLRPSNKTCNDCRCAVMRQAGLEPLEPYPGRQRPWNCRCLTCGETVNPRYANVKSGGGCWFCSYRKRAAAQRISEEEAVAIMYQAGLEPMEPYRNKDTAWCCRCLTCGREPSPRLSNVKSGRSAGCFYCAERAVVPEEAVAVMRAAGLEPLAPYPGTGAPWSCRCDRCGRAVSPTYSAVKNGGGCRPCGRGTPLADVAIALVRAKGLEPLEPFQDATSRWRLRCMKCGATTPTTYVNIQRSVGGCQWCRERGFKAYEDAVVYLIAHPGYDAVKVGVTDAAGGRLATHRQKGWVVIATVHVPGTTALAIESDILTWWREGLGLPPYLGRTEMPQGGWTETVDASGIDLAATIARIQELSA